MKHSSVTTTCAVRMGSDEVSVQACRSWTDVHLGQLQQVATHLLEVDVLRGRLQQDAQRRPQQRHGRLHHEEDDQD